MMAKAKHKTATSTPIDSSAELLFNGTGAMRALCREFDWASNRLGPVGSWPVSLRTTVATMLASHHPMFLWWGPELIQIYNDAYRPSFGEGGRDLRALGARGAEFWTEIWDIIGPQIEQVMQGGESTWHEDQLVPIERNGRIENVWWTYGYSPAFDDAGRVNGVLVVCQETTRRILDTQEREQLLAETARAERRAARVLEQVSDEHLTMDSEFRILSVNDAALRALGRQRADLVGSTHWAAFPASAGSAIEGHYRAVMTERVEAHLTHHYVGEGYDRHLEIDVYPTDEGGLALFWRDVSERKRAEELQLNARQEIERLYSLEHHARASAEEAYRVAEAANRAKSEFLAVMSHELRTPLNAIGGYAELMEMGIRGAVSPEQREDLRRIQTSQRHLLGLINEVLNYAKIETGTVHYDIEDVWMRDALSAAESLVAPQARTKRLTLSVGDCPETVAVRADPEKLRQILVNLLSNAVKFTDAGGTIHMWCKTYLETVVVVVRDTGIGIAGEKINTIFDPFVQVRSDLSRPHEGTGLGLAISRDLARGMGGDLTVESEIGAGSVFALTLPAAAL